MDYFDALELGEEMISEGLKALKRTIGLHGVDTITSFDLWLFHTWFKKKKYFLQQRKKKLKLKKRWDQEKNKKAIILFWGSWNASSVRHLHGERVSGKQAVVPPLSVHDGGESDGQRWVPRQTSSWHASYVCLCVCVLLCVCVCVCMYLSSFVCVCVYVFVLFCVCEYLCVCVCVLFCVCVAFAPPLQNKPTNISSY